MLEPLWGRGRRRQQKKRTRSRIDRPSIQKKEDIAQEVAKVIQLKPLVAIVADYAQPTLRDAILRSGANEDWFMLAAPNCDRLGAVVDFFRAMAFPNGEWDIGRWLASCHDYYESPPDPRSNSFCLEAPPLEMNRPSLPFTSKQIDELDELYARLSKNE